jgi:hypothetical protein
VRRLLAFGSAAVAAFGLVRWLTTRQRGEPAVVEPPADPRARELRRRLDESRAVVGEREEFESGETTVDAAEPAPADPDARRRRVHEEARGVVDEMRDSSAD